MNKVRAFEFRARKQFNLAKGCDDLIGKCKDSAENHGVLIAVSDTAKTERQWWVVNNKWVWVVLVVW
jgi:hypothetical protein